MKTPQGKIILLQGIEEEKNLDFDQKEEKDHTLQARLVLQAKGDIDINQKDNKCLIIVYKLKLYF